MTFFYIGIFGILGVYSRFLLGNAIARYAPSQFPFGTFTINILGSILIGIVYVLGFEKSLVSENLRLGIVVGFLGGFTTFSAFTLETAHLLEESRYMAAFLYLGLSPILGLGGTVLGIFIMRSLVGRKIP